MPETIKRKYSINNFGPFLDENGKKIKNKEHLLKCKDCNGDAHQAFMGKLSPLRVFCPKCDKLPKCPFVSNLYLPPRKDTRSHVIVF